MIRFAHKPVMLLAVLGCLTASVARADDACSANFLVVLDRSCSMNGTLASGDSQTKWQSASAAIEQLIAQAGSQAGFGLALFPTPPETNVDMSGGKCDVLGPVTVPVAAGTADAITSALTAHPPTGPCSTPLKQGLDQAATEPHFAQAYTPGATRSYAILITDGMQGCGATDQDVVDSVTTLYARGYPTYVVGFGSEADPVMLGKAAIAGGVPRTSFVDDAGVPYDAGGLSYYQADDAAALNNALQSILGQVVGEFSTCAGTPCPDGRCFATGQTCQAGFCVSPAPDFGGSISLDASAEVRDAGRDGGGSHATASSGCGCDVGGRPLTPAALLFACAALAAVLVARRAAA